MKEKSSRFFVVGLFFFCFFVFVFVGRGGGVIHVFISSVHALSSLVRLVTSLRAVCHPRKTDDLQSG